jgi:hypothetical protein
MAKETITKCDGCDQAIADGESAHRTVAIGAVTLGPYDLCPPCDARLIDVANPTKWPRKKPRKARKAKP